MATNAWSFRGLLKPSLRAVILAQFLPAVLFVLPASGQTPPPGSTAFPPVTDAEVIAFMQAQKKDMAAALTIRSNPKRVPLLLGAIKRDPAGFWAGELHGSCFVEDRAIAGRLPAAERPKVYERIVVYMSTALTTISNACQKAPQNQVLKHNLNLIEKDLALVRAELAVRPKDTGPATSSTPVPNQSNRPGTTVPGQNSASALRAKACGSYLNQIDLAKQMWQVDNNKPATATPTARDLIDYFPPDHKIPRCPDGGTYILGRLNQKPTCSFPGHVLPPRPK